MTKVFLLMRSWSRMRPVLKPWAAIATFVLFGVSMVRIIFFGREWYMGNVELSGIQPKQVGNRHSVRSHHNKEHVFDRLLFKRRTGPFVEAEGKDLFMRPREKGGTIFKNTKHGIGRNHIKNISSKMHNVTKVNNVPEIHMKGNSTHRGHLAGKKGGIAVNVHKGKNVTHKMDPKHVTDRHRVSATHKAKEPIINSHFARVTTQKMQKLFFLDFSNSSDLPVGRIAYLGKLFHMFKKWGATGLLIDYRDMFPFSGHLEVLSTANAFTVTEIKQIVRLARNNAFTVIPLVQTFSHMDFVLKHDKFKHLQELKGSPDCIIPLKSESLLLIYEMINQTMKLHPASSHIHIGADDVVHLGKSKKSRKYMEMLEIDKDMLFLRHVRAIASHLNKTYASRVRPIIWDGMLHQIRLHDMQKAKVGRLVEPMVWIYGPRTKSHIEKKLQNNYSKVFHHIWLAGDLGKGFNITNLTQDLQKSNYWTRTISAINGTFSKIEGLALTGFESNAKIPG